ncbi:aerobic carbon-monoxide dehydrogenase large subunit [Dictyobacter aurantiacus]|uniref:Dehydrogenase n=1 Tax=Dictyobacter aurantiacus TaxID=1936993 RepID=A0A401ZIT2_9CHLR|nr:aerobic carbon-monoxide dehydrogenase large subunit [Dictyobacter aurantiacus]GCE06757.1 dehydrogenase [Dictyobacter aurantiacus]
MATRWFGAPVRRNEDPRLLRGEGTYVDDIDLPEMLHAAVLRSPYARAKIRGIDTRAARALPGVHMVLSAADLGEVLEPSPLLIPHQALTQPRTQLPLATHDVRYVGEAVAFVVAESRYLAEDALGLVDVEYEPLPAVHSLAVASASEAPLVHEDVPGNLAAHLVQSVGCPDKVIASAPHVIRETFEMERGAAMPLECRGIVARWDRYEQMLTCWISTQAPIPLRNGLAAIFHLPEHKVRVIAPDVGGGFGPKIMLFYPEEVLTPLASMRLGRPVKWIEDRRENFISTNQERGQLHEVEYAFDDLGQLLAVRDVFQHDTGAYTPYGIMVPIITACSLPGPYRLKHYASDCRVFYTNKVPVSPYRGAGRPHAVFVMERIMDRIARELGMDRLEVRARNFIRPEEFPWDVGLVYQDGGPTRYDSGNYQAALDKLKELLDYGGFAIRQAQARAQGRYLGLGVGYYVEGTSIGPYEGAHVRVESDGRVFVSTGVTSQGQSHQTVFAQIVAEQLGIEPGNVLVTEGDSQAFYWGVGTFASRAATIAGSAVHLAALKVREKVRTLAAELLEALPEDIELAGGKAFVKGTPQRALTLGQLAIKANPLRYTYGESARTLAAMNLAAARPGPALPSERGGPGLEADGFYSPPHGSFASGIHGAIIEVDPRTAMVSFVKYVAVHDCGRLINPLVVEGQVHGGVAQGIGGAFFERLVFDETAQPLSATFMDYLIPTAAEIPDITVEHIETPSPLNPLGIKGVGEAGTIPVAALFASAIDDALSPWKVRIREMPLHPCRLHEIIQAASGTTPHDPVHGG